MKKFTVIACLSTLFVTPLAAHADWKGNWLLGVSGGYNWYDWELTSTAVDSAFAPYNFTFDHDFDETGWLWGILGGYQAMCDRWLIGAELSVDWDNKSHTQNAHFRTTLQGVPGNFLTQSTYDRDATVALTARFGYEVACWLLPYIRLGIETSRDKLDFTISDTADARATFNTTLSDRAYRFIGGVGVELPVPACDGLSLRAEYNYHSRHSFDTNGNWPAPFATTSSNIDTHYHVNTAKVSVVYNFGI